jgi:hypothetical protein
MCKNNVQQCDICDTLFEVQGASVIKVRWNSVDREYDFYVCDTCKQQAAKLIAFKKRLTNKEMTFFEALASIQHSNQVPRHQWKMEYMATFPNVKEEKHE